jgi:hypothetical protein
VDRHNPAIFFFYVPSMPAAKNQQPKQTRKDTPRVRDTPRRRSGSRVGDDLVEAFEQVAAHIRGEIELDDVAPPARN